MKSLARAAAALVMAFATAASAQTYNLDRARLYTMPGLSIAQRDDQIGHLVIAFSGMGPGAIGAARESVEQSVFTRALPTFDDLYWGFQPQAFGLPSRGVYLIDRGAPLGALRQNDAATYATAALSGNLGRLSVFARTKCRLLSPAQQAFLFDYADARFAQLKAQSTSRAADIARAMGGPVRPVEGVAFVRAADCARSATADGGGVMVSSDLLLLSLFSAIYVDQQVVTVPDRVFAAMDALRTAPGQPLNENAARDALRRISATVVWQNTLRGLRTMYRREFLTLEDFEKELFRDLELTVPACRQTRTMCRLYAVTALAYAAAAKVDLLFREQVDFMLAHELGHHALGHVSVPIGTCEEEKAREAAADRYAIALMRPPQGLSTVPPMSPFLNEARVQAFDGRFRSGVDLFMAQSHRLALLVNGDNCAYPTFEARLVAARAFEARAWPQ